MWVRPHWCACVRYPSVCPVMKAVSIRTNPTISTSRLNDRAIFTLSVTEGRRKRKSERGRSEESTATVKNEERHIGSIKSKDGQTDGRRDGRQLLPLMNKILAELNLLSPVDLKHLKMRIKGWGNAKN